MTTSPKPTKDEALKLALEALETLVDRFMPVRSEFIFSKRMALDQANAAILPIREAIAQPAADDNSVEGGERAIWRVRYHGSPDLQGYNIYAFNNHTATHGDFVANLGENGNAAEALCSDHNTALLTADDKAGGEVAHIDRADAVNLARNIIEGDSDDITQKGVRVLCDAILRMDAAILSSGKDDDAAIVTGMIEDRSGVLHCCINTEFKPLTKLYTRPQPQADQPAEQCRRELRGPNEYVCDCKPGECPGGQPVEPSGIDAGENPPNKTLYLMMARHGLNMVVGEDMGRLLAFGRDVWRGAQSEQPAERVALLEIKAIAENADLAPGDRLQRIISKIVIKHGVK